MDDSIRNDVDRPITDEQAAQTTGGWKVPGHWECKKCKHIERGMIGTGLKKTCPKCGSAMSPVTKEGV